MRLLGMGWLIGAGRYLGRGEVDGLLYISFSFFLVCCYLDLDRSTASLFFIFFTHTLSVGMVYFILFFLSGNDGFTLILYVGVVSSPVPIYFDQLTYNKRCVVSFDGDAVCLVTL